MQCTPSIIGSIPHKVKQEVDEVTELWRTQFIFPANPLLVVKSFLLLLSIKVNLIDHLHRTITYDEFVCLLPSWQIRNVAHGYVGIGSSARIAKGTNGGLNLLQPQSKCR